MNERMNESLSALVDGEADELEVRRLLNQVETDDDLRATWNRYQIIGSVMRGEAVSSVDLLKGINQALDGEPMDDVVVPAARSVKTASAWHKLAASGAVAASVMFAVVIGFQWQQEPQVNGAVPAMVSTMSAASNDEVLQVAAAEPMSAEQQAQLEEAQRKLQEYVLQHNEHATESPARTMLPFARTVSFPQGEEPKP